MIMWVECSECNPCMEMLVVLLNCNLLAVLSHVKHWQQQALFCLSSTTTVLICSDIECKNVIYNDHLMMSFNLGERGWGDGGLEVRKIYFKLLRQHWYATFKHKYESWGQFHTIRTTASAESTAATQSGIFKLKHTTLLVPCAIITK